MECAEADETYRHFVIDRDLTRQPPGERLIKLMTSMREYLGETSMMAYLTMMAPRLLELRRVLKDTGSIYLHCDSTASHYLKILMDGIFGVENCRNEIVWQRTSAHNEYSRFGRNTDRLLFYARGSVATFNTIFLSYHQSYVESFYRYTDTHGRYQLGDLTGAGLRNGDSGLAWKGYDPSSTGRHWAVPGRFVAKLATVAQIAEMTVQQKLDLLESNGYVAFTGKGTPRFKRYLSEMPGAMAQEQRPGCQAHGLPNAETAGAAGAHHPGIVQ